MPESSIVAIFMLLGVICSCGAFVAGFVAFFARARTREFAINVLLVLATVPVVLVLSLTHVTRQTPSKQYLEFSNDEDPIKFCLNIASALPIATERNPLVKQVSAIGYPIPARTTIMDASLRKLKQLLTEHPDNENLAARYMLVGAMSDDPRAGRNEALYWATKLPDSKIVKVVFNLLCNKDPIDDNTARQNKKQILSSLPPGWYQQTALMLNEKLAGRNEEYERNMRARQEVAVTASFTFTAAILALLVIDVMGIFFLVKSIRLGKNLIPDKENFHSPTLTFRSFYAVLLCSFWGLLLATLTVCLVSAILRQYDELSRTLLPLCNIGEFVAVFAGVYFFVLAPRSLKFSSINDLLNFNCTAALMPKYLRNGFAAFCIIQLFLTLWGLGVAQFVGSDVERLTTGRFLDWVSAPTSFNSLVHFVTECLVSPVSSQVIFRALFYGWLRKRFNILPAIFVSAVFNTEITDGVEHYLPMVVESAIYAVVYERTRSIVPAIVAEVFVDSSRLILALFFACTGIR